MIFDDLISETEARAHLRALRSGHAVSSGILWLQLGTFLFENDISEWEGLNAVTCFTRAQQSFTASSSAELADAKLGLGAALIEAESGYRDPTLENAIEELSQAVELYTQSSDAEGETRARFYRAYAWTELVGQNRYLGSELAIKELSAISQNTTTSDDLPFAANVSLMLGSAYLDRVEGDPRENSARAEEAFRAAVDFYEHDDDNNDHGRAQAYLDLAVTFNERQRLGDEAAGEIAIDHARRALAYCDSDIPHEVYTSILSNLATALAEQGGPNHLSNLRQAEDLLDEGIKISEARESIGGKVLRLVRAGLILELCQYHNAKRMMDVKQDLASCNGHFDPVETTQWWLEWQELRALAAAVEDDAQSMIARAEEVLTQSQILLENTGPFAEKTHLLSQLSLTLDLGLLGHLKANSPVAGLFFAREIYGRMLGVETAPFTQPEQTAELYLLNPATEDWSGVLLVGDDYCDFYQLDGLGHDFWRAAQTGLQEGFFSGMEAFRRLGGANQFATALEEWIAVISGALGPVLHDLEEGGFTALVVFAFGGWCTVPIAALQLTGSHAGVLGDKISVHLGPDQFSERPIAQNRLLHIVDPKLEESSAEVKMLQQGCQAYAQAQTLSEIQSALTTQMPFDIIHFTTHGAHDFDYLDGAGIKSADGKTLTARWIFENAKLKGGPLVCLAACQTGLADFTKLPHETFGLPTALLSAGASAVISTLWPVDDVATRLLIQHFYQRLNSGSPAARALQEAQIWLRSTDEAELETASASGLRFTLFENGANGPPEAPFSHPYFWSGFVLHRA